MAGARLIPKSESAIPVRRFFTMIPPGPGRDLQRQLLSDEGVEFRPDGSIDLDRYLWEG